MSDLMPYPWQMVTWETLTGLLAENRLPHALLFSGEKADGKDRLIAAFAKKLLCHDNQDFACGKCKACQLFDAGSHPDFSTVGLEEKAQQIKINQIRKVIDLVSKTPQLGGRKVILLDPAEAMNLNAANALLKCLEEPSGDTVMILATDASHRLLPTIRSRCQEVVSVKPDEKVSEEWLSAFVPDQQQRQSLLMLSNNNPVRALAFYESNVLELYENTVADLKSLQSSQTSVLSLAEKIAKDDVLLWLEISQKIVWALISTALDAGRVTLGSFENFLPVVQKQGFSKRAYSVLQELQLASYEVQGPTNPNKQLLLENLLIRMQALLRG